MTEILCRWLNDELSVSQKIEQTTFSKDFSSGYLIGEVLHKHGLQNDFDQFSQSKTADSKLSNFMRIEPTLHLLGIPFDINLARDVMTEKHGVSTRLMYQLYVALNNKKKANLTGVAMETMRPAAPAKLNAVESGIYKDRLKHITPRQTDLDLNELVEHYHEKQIEMEKTAFRERFLEQEKIRQQQQAHRQMLLERSREMRLKQSEMVAKLQAATVNIPVPPEENTKKAQHMRRTNRMKKEATETTNAISSFEEKMNSSVPPSKDDDEGIDMEYIMGRDEEKSALDLVDLIKPTSNDEYIGKIRKRLEEDASARSEREKRRRKVLVDQMKAHEAQEEARREEMLVNRLMRQSQQERRIAVQLLQARHEKEIIRRNRIIHEKQYEERRFRDFEDALNREAELAQQARKEYEEQTRKDRELHDKIAAERAETKYRKHYDMCMEIMNQIVDFSCKVGEYRELTNNLVPSKLMREWRSLFVEGQLLCEPVPPSHSTEPTPEQVLEEDRQQLLDEGDFTEYKTMVGEWQPPEGCEFTGPPKANAVLGHIIQRLFNMVHPPSALPPPPEFPPFPIRACVLGKVFSGKTTCVKKLAKEHRLEVLNADQLVKEAIEAHKNMETMETSESEADPETNTDQDSSSESADGNSSSLSESQEQHPRHTQRPDKGSEKPSPTAQAAKIQINIRAPTGESGFSSRAKPTIQGPLRAESEAATKETESPVKKTKPKEARKPQATPRAKLGMKALKFLKKGQPVDDQVIVDVVVEAIRRVPKGTGWILDGFPANYNQSKILEKALSGFDAAEKDAAKKGLKQKKSGLVPDPRPPPPPPEPASGIDVAIVFDIPDDLCLRRAAGRTKAIQSEKEYQEEFNPPPEGSATGVGKVEKVVPVEDPAFDQEQIQHRITGFLDAWPKLEKWFSKFGTLHHVDSIQDSRSVYLEVEKIMEDTLAKLQGKDKESTPAEPTETPRVEEKKVEPLPPPPAEPPKTPPPEERAGSRSGSRKGSGKKTSRPSSKESRSKSPKDKNKDTDKKRDKSGSPKRGSGKKSEGGSAKKGSRGSSPKSKKGSGKKKTPEPEPEPEPKKEPEGPPPPIPGSEEWEFVDQFLEFDLSKILSQHWETVENTYVKNSKFVFRKLRDERENIYRYFFQIRKDFQTYLRRPDTKQQFVSQWQKEYNSVPDDIRDDEETKAEQHQRVDDLRERMWNICDERKEQAEKERETVMNDGWLDDRMGVLSNFYITLMQSEVDRFQDTVRLLKDYYRGMQGHIPDDLNVNYARLPLLELPVVRPESPDKPSSETAPTPPAEERPTSGKSGDRPRSKSPKSPKGSRSKSPRDKSPKDRPKSGSRTPSGKKRDKSKEKEKPAELLPAVETDQALKKRIPLVPRRPQSPDADGKGAPAAKDKKDKKKKEDGVESPVPPQDPDERLIFDAYYAGINGIGSIRNAIQKSMQAEQTAREAAEEADRRKEEEKQKEAAAAAAANNKKGGAKDKGGAKKGKSRSPSANKKGKGDGSPSTPQPPPDYGKKKPSEPETEEEKAKKNVHEKMKQEFYHAIKEEDLASKIRLELIKLVAMAIIQDLKHKADEAYKDMNDWLGARFLKEMESIEHMSEVMRNAIEIKTKLKQELVLKQEDFLLNENVVVLKSASPPPARTPGEAPIYDHFTVNQLLQLYDQFVKTAPTGVMSSKSFVETFENIVALTHGMEELPDVWTTITPVQIQEISNGLSSDSEYVDWRRFMLALAQPLPFPSQTDLLQTLGHFREMDQKSTGFVTREQYDRMDLWFTTQAITERSFDRLTRLKATLFDIFANHDRIPPVLDYIGMLLYFSTSSHAQEGLMRALSVASGTHMPRFPKVLPRSESRTITPELPEEPLEHFSPQPPVPDDIPPEAAEARVPLEALYRVLHHGENAKGDSHRFSVTADPEDATSRERLTTVYRELGSDNLQPLPLKVLIEHPLIQDVFMACQTFKSLDLKAVFTNPAITDPLDSHSTKTID